MEEDDVDALPCSKCPALFQMQLRFMLMLHAKVTALLLAEDAGNSIHMGL